MAALDHPEKSSEGPKGGRLPTGCFHIEPDSDSGLTVSRYDLTDFEWRVIEPLLPNKREASRASMIGAC
jgi:hypothetical protein